MNYARIGPRVNPNFDTPEAAVVRRVRRRISHQVLAPQFGFYLTKVLEQVIGATREISPSAGFFAEASQHVFAHAFESEAVANAYRVNDDAGAPRAATEGLAEA